MNVVDAVGKLALALDGELLVRMSMFCKCSAFFFSSLKKNRIGICITSLFGLRMFFVHVAKCY